MALRQAFRCRSALTSGTPTSKVDLGSRSFYTFDPRLCHSSRTAMPVMPVMPLSKATAKSVKICQNLSKGPPPVHCFEGSDGVARYCLLSNGVGSAHDGFPEARRPLAHHASRITKVQGFDKGFDKEWMCWEVARIFQH